MGKYYYMAMSSSKKNQPLFENAVKDYLESCTSARLSQNKKIGIPEFEIRFGLNKSITKMDYDNVVKELYLNKWNTDKIDGTQLLRISPEIYHLRENGESNDRKDYEKPKIRLEIEGSDMIEIYCKTNSFEALKNTPSSHKKIKFLQKKQLSNPIGIDEQSYIDYPDFDFRISSQNELSFPITSDVDIIRKIIHNWNPAKKFFRTMNRTRFSDENNIVFVDISIVKSNKTYNNKKNAILCQTIQEAGVFTNMEKYEIELELNNAKITEMMDNNNDKTNIDGLVQKVIQEIRKCIRIVLSGIQGTLYPISYMEQEEILQEYMRRITPNEEEEEKDKEKDKEKDEKMPMIKPYFIGPSSVTLQMINIVPNQNPQIPNIAIDYTVTEKADGQRALLYISEKGKLYMIRTNLSIVFTGAITEKKECWNSLLDGEYIEYGKSSEGKKFLNLFAAFDIYYIGSRRDKDGSVRELAFCSKEIDIDKTQYRLTLLETFIQDLQIQSIVGKDAKCKFQIRCKTFYKGMDSKGIIIREKREKGEKREKELEEGELDEEEIDNIDDTSIFQAAEEIWNRKDNLEYIIDGLIYTPMNTGIGSNVVGKANDLGRKFTWDRSFKWKPPQYNTIDFLISVQKDKYGKEIIRNKVILDNTGNITSMLQYKTLILKCGFNPNTRKNVNVFSDVLFNRTSTKKKEDYDEDTDNFGIVNGKGYQPVNFQPSSPYDKDACYCNVILEDQNIMRTVENEIFQDDMIIEFSYNTEIKDTETAWKWVPLRVRYDKTSELRANKNNFGNDYTVANNNWYSIHYPITEKMIIGQDIPTTSDLDDTVYYNRVDKDSIKTQALKDFHNLFVKRYVIKNVAKYLHENMHLTSILLMDYAVGKCGDLQKWIESDINFVFGVDISKDNIMNSKDGACVRYLKKKENPRLKLNAVFLQGNSSKNIFSTQQAFNTEQEKNIAKAIFGQGGIDAAKNIAKEYVGIGRDGFHISSCQFAMHYFFENNDTLHSFLRNLSECTRVDGFFIGTCYDGERVFDLLRKKSKDQSIRLEKNGKKIFEITKKYSDELESLPDNENSIGLPIYVYQESIDKTFMEYLVNFKYFDYLMEEYGFVPLNKDNNKSMGFIDNNNSFGQLFRFMEKEIRTSRENIYGKSLEMSPEEKTISFLNRYFVYKKARVVSPEKLQKLYNKYVKKEENKYDKEEEEEEVEKMEKDKNNLLRKIPDKKIVLSLDNYHPIKEEKEGEGEKEFGEYQDIFDKLNVASRNKITNYTKKQQIDILKKLQQQQKKKMVTAKK